MIIVQSLSKKFKHGRVVALHQINLAFPDSGFVAIVGESGSGKSTLMNLLGGLDKPTAGTIIYNDGTRDYNYRKKKDMCFLQKHILSGIMQEHLFAEDISIRKNICLGVGIQGGTVDEKKKEKIAGLLSRTKLQERADHKPTEVSGGQRQRATLVRGLARSSSVILADEPTASQDEESELTLFELLKQESENKLVILVTHSKTLAYRYCDRVVELCGGEVSKDVIVNHNGIYQKTEFRENEVAIFREAELSAEDWQYIDDYARSRGRISIVVENQPDFVPNATEPIRQKARRESLCRHSDIHALGAVFKTVWKKRIAVVLLISLAIGILLSLMASLQWFIDYDSAKAANALYWLNGYREVSFVSRAGSNRNDNHLMFDDLRNSIGAHINELKNGTMFLTDVSVPKTEEEATQFFGYRFCSPGEVTLLAGEFCEGQGVMITDFVADSVIRNSDKYNSYEDILSQGLRVAFRTLTVTGIIQTDYRELLEEKAANQNKKSKEFSYKKEDCYLRLYLNHSLLDEKHTASSYDWVILNQGMIIARVVLCDRVAEEGRRYIAINPALNQLLQSADNKISVDNLDFSVRIEEDDDPIPTVYAETTTYQSILNASMGMQGCVLQLKEDDSSAFRSLTSKAFEHRSAISETIYKIDDTVTSLLALIGVVFIAGFVCVAVAVLCTPLTYTGHLRKLAGMCRAWGSGFTDLFRLESLFGLANLACVAVMSAVAFGLVSMGAGTILSKSYGIQVMWQVKSNTRFWLLALAVVVAVILAETLFLACKRYYGTIVNMLKEK